MAGTNMDAPQATTPKVVIQGLNDSQCADLAGVKVGTLLEVAIFERAKKSSSSDDGAEDGSDGEEDGSDGDESEEDSDDEVYESAREGESSDIDEVTTPDNTAVADLVTKAARVSESLQQLVDEMNEQRSEESSADAADVDTVENAHSEQNGTEDGTHDTNITSGVDAPPISPRSYAQVLKEAAEANVSETDGENGEQVDEEDGNDESRDPDDDEADDEDEDEEDDEEEEQPWEQVSHELYVVISITKQDGDDSTITDIRLRKLTYRNPSQSANIDSYRIFGSTIILEDKSVTPLDGEESWSVAEVTAPQPDYEYSYTITPISSGGQIRRGIFGSVCPARCNRGWLADQAALADLVDDKLQSLRPYRPLCPVCLGKTLMNEQIRLRTMMDSMHVVDIGLVAEYLGRLNTKRRRCGYSFVQFDEREWGYLFDDMLDEDASDRDDEDGTAGQFEHWDEAMDPNANPKARPASEDTIAALPRKMFGEVAKKEGEEDGVSCGICQEEAFTAESEVVDLPCGHVYDVDCLVSWIKEYDNCPICRKTVSGMVGLGGDASDAGDHELPDSADKEEELRTLSAAENEAIKELVTGLKQEEGAGIGTEPDMDGEDTVMSDTEEVSAEQGSSW